MNQEFESSDVGGSSPRDVSIFANRRGLLTAVLVALFLVAAVVRLVNLDAPGVLVDRDFTSAMFAREFYFEHANDIEPWRREIARATLNNQPTLEPPVTEWLASILYRIAGREDLRLARILTCTFWLVGGWFLFRTTQRLVATDAAVFALAYYLLLPYSILLSRSFQADSLMMLGFLASLYLIVRYHEAPSQQRLLFAALVAATTLIYRPLVLLALIGAFAVPVMARRGPIRGALDRATFTYAAIAVLPAVLYYGYATFVAHHFGWKLTSSFRFHLFGHVEYWAGWGVLVLIVVGALPLVLAACGVVLLRAGLPRSVIVGLSLGYLGFGLLFTMHIHTHEYYSAQLIPTVAIAGSPVAMLLAQRFVAARGRALKAVALAVAGGVTCAGIAFELYQAFQRTHNEPPAVAREIGGIVGHSAKVIFLAPYYGLSLQYLGELTGAYWPRAITYQLYRAKDERELSIGERLAAIPFEPEFFVITDFPEFEGHHQDLAAYLQSRCHLTAQTPDYLIYESCAPPP